MKYRIFRQFKKNCEVSSTGTVENEANNYIGIKGIGIKSELEVKKIV